MGIRRYGPGKFYTILDSFAYAVTLEGADEEASYGDGGEGWFGLLWLDDDTRKAISEDADNANETLTGEEEQFLDDNVAVIFFERSDGIVEADWFDKKADAEKAWAEILVDTEDEEDEDEDDEEDEEDE